jgi:hypothetical protein
VTRAMYAAFCQQLRAVATVPLPVVGPGR